MRNQEFKEKMHEYSLWRANLIQSIEKYKQWLSRYGLETPHSNNIILNSLDGLKHDRITLAFVAEFSRGKTELINAMFFAESGIRLLPSSPGRTTMSPTEIFYDEAGGNYIRLLTIESRLEAISVTDTYIMFMIPIPPTSKDIPDIAPNNRVRILLIELNVCTISACDLT